jgi:hypothetical protein
MVALFPPCRSLAVARPAQRQDTKSILDQLKQGLGEESKFGNTLKAFAGAGALAGLSLAGIEVKKLADQFVEIRKMMADGAGAGQIAEELAKSLPVFGSFFEAGRKTRAELDGSADAARKVAMETATISTGGDYAVARFERMDEVPGVAPCDPDEEG